MLNRKAILLASALSLAAMAATPVLALEQERHSIVLPAQSLHESLQQLPRLTGVQLIYTDPALRQQRAPAINERLTPEEALVRLLAGSGFKHRFVNANTVRIFREDQAQAETFPDTALSSEASAVGDIVVTGSRIRRSTFDTPTPVVGVSADDLQESGTTELSEMLADLPAATSTLNDSTVAGNVQNSGLSAIQLRNLGDNRTLVLIDGRRTVSNSANANRVSTSTIPSSFVDRVEIITGGASSVYGSDAVAGVVNIITTRDTGLSVRARAGVSEEGDGEEQTYEILWGKNFADKRGYFALSGTYDRDHGIRAADRDWATRQASYAYNAELGRNEFETLYTDANGVLISDYQPASSFPPNAYRDLSGNTAGGVFYGANSAQRRFYEGGGLVPLGPNTQTGAPVLPGQRDDGNTGYFLANRDGYNQREHRSLILPRERYLLAAKADYDLRPNLNLFGQLQYSRVDTQERREPVGLTFNSTVSVFDPDTGLQTDETLGRIPCRRADLGDCNPTVPYDVFANNLSASTQGIAWARRFNEVGYRDTTNRRDTLRSWVGLRGDAWGDWTWEATAGYGRYEQEQHRRNEINGLALRHGLNAERGPDGAIRCADAAARAAGCVPVNLFGEGAITAEAADYIRADLHQQVTIEQHTLQAFMAGSVMQLPAGPLSAAFGADFRKDSQSLRGDRLSNLGGTSGNPVPDFDGEISAIESFAEVSVPILADLPFARMLSLDASVRLADYDIANVGTVFSYRAGLQWAPNTDLRLRAQTARSQRAPDIAELFSPPRGDFDTVSDICSNVTPATAGRIAERCREEVGIQAAFAEALNQGNTVRYRQSGSSVYSPNGGNLDLKEETADTLTLGAVYTPSFIPRLTLSVDYYAIDIKDAITQYANEDILIQCYASDRSIADNPFCADVSRNQNDGQISSLTQRQFNVAGLESSGIDVALQYRFNLDAIGVPGRWDLRYDGSHVLKQKHRFEGLEGEVVTDQRGDLSQGSFDYRGRASLSWRLNDFRLRYTVKYLSPTLDSRFRLQQYEALLQTMPDAEYPLFLRIPEMWEHDLYAGYDLDVGGHDIRLYAGVNNLLDEVSPFLPSGDVFSGRLANYNGAYDTAGRRYYFGVTVKF